MTARVPTQGWMTAPETRAVVEALEAGGAEVRFVGGCVRDALLGRSVKDIDLATPAPPERVMALLEAAGLGAVPTGIKHGTVTAVSNHRPYEITTLRVDVEPLGRHAKVAFTDDWEADAARRDFTINAMSCAPDGRLYDPFGGRADLEAGRVRFVGEARRRIEEDHLRLLRLFRFHAHYGRGRLDAEGLAAAEALAPRIARLSAERVHAELLKLLRAPDPVPVVRVMVDHGVLAALLPEAREADSLAALLALEPVYDPAPDPSREPDALRRLAALLPTELGLADGLTARLRLSRAEAVRLRVMLEPAPARDDWRAERPLRRLLHALGRDPVRDLLLLDQARRSAAGAAAETAGLEAALATVEAWQPVAFPLRGRDAAALGVAHGPEVGRLLKAVEDWWIEEDFRPSHASCLERLRALVEAQEA